jgi:catechol 2,3-dioxygenase
MVHRHLRALLVSITSPSFTPPRASLANAFRRLSAAGIPLEGASDHGVSEALYLRDPDDNVIELYWDRPRDAWPRSTDGSVKMYTQPLMIEELLTSSMD